MKSSLNVIGYKLQTQGLYRENMQFVSSPVLRHAHLGEKKNASLKLTHLICTNILWYHYPLLQVRKWGLETENEVLCHFLTGVKLNLNIQLFHHHNILYFINMRTGTHISPKCSNWEENKANSYQVLSADGRWGGDSWVIF